MNVSGGSEPRPLTVNSAPTNIVQAETPHATLPPVMNSWIRFITRLYRALVMTPITDCYGVGGGNTQALPTFIPDVDGCSIPPFFSVTGFPRVLSEGSDKGCGWRTSCTT